MSEGPAEAADEAAEDDQSRGGQQAQAPADLPGERASDEPAMATAGRDVVAAAAAASIPVRLLGGVAIWMRASPGARAALGRAYPDIDLVAHKKQSRPLRTVLEAAGLEPERVFNATHGARRLLYYGPPHQHGSDWHVDIFLDTFEMSHTLDLGSRLETEPDTLPAAELLLTKLQVAEVNRKDLSDTAMLLWDHEPASSDGPGLLNAAQVAAVCAADWGLYTTVTDNLGTLAGMLDELVGDQAARTRIGGRTQQISAALESAPKTTSWRLRSRVGRRVRWYQVPEEITR